MASLQILKSALSPISPSHIDFCRKFSSWSSELDSEVRRKRVLRLASAKNYLRKGFRIRCGTKEGDNQSNGEEPPESLFMKELKRRGMTPTSLLEDSKRNIYEQDEDIESERSFSKRNAVSTDLDKSVLGQRERSMSLNSEGLEGLIPRAKLLLTVGGTFFLGFGPLILVTVGFFSALYLYFGPSFVHDGSKTSVAPPQYIDPYALLEDERISQTAPRVN